MKDGTLSGVLWHQGENDSGREADAQSYGKRLSGMIQDLRAELGQTNLPVVVGQIGEFLYTRQGNKSPYAKVVNGALLAIPQTVPFTACAKSEGLTAKSDEVHFNAESQHEFGRRYAAEMLRLQAEAK
jgi:hypothetical protein